MNQTEMLQKIEAQRAFFAAGNTRPVAARIEVLKSLRAAILEMEPEINAALKADLGKSASEG